MRGAIEGGDGGEDVVLNEDEGDYEEGGYCGEDLAG